MKTVLITGILGLVGSASAKVFKDAGYRVVGIDNNARSHYFNTPEKSSQEFVLYSTDINGSFVRRIVEEQKPDVIIHAAAQPSHDYSKNNVLEDFDTNARGTIILLEATRKHTPDATFIYVSTDKVYGENMSIGPRGMSDGRFPHLRKGETRYIPAHGLIKNEYEHGFTEKLGLDFAGARSPFGCSKTAGDIYTQEYGNYFGMKTGIFRPGCITGKNHEGAELHGFLAYLAKCIKTGTHYRIFGDGLAVRDQIHADDLAAAFLAFAQNPKIAAVYNIGGGHERAVSVIEAIKLIEQETGKKADFDFYEPRKGDRTYDVHDVAKFKRDYPEWDYKYSLSDIISDVCAKAL